MSHVHHPSEHESSSRIGVAFFLNLSFTVIELIGGILTNSVAVLSDALHDLGDSISLGMSYYMQKLSTKGRDHRFSYGYKRFSLLSAFINGVVLIVGSVFMLMEAVPRIFHPKEVMAEGMIVLAILGIIFNTLGALRLSGGRTLNEKLLSFHLLEDVFGWVAVLIGGTIMYFFHAPYLDSVLSIIFTLWTLWKVIRLFKQTSMIFLQSVPIDLDVKKLEEIASGIKGVNSFHDLHVWSMDGAYHILTVHLVVAKNMSEKEILTIRKHAHELFHNHHIEHATIEMEREGEECCLLHSCE